MCKSQFKYKSHSTKSQQTNYEISNMRAQVTSRVYLILEGSQSSQKSISVLDKFPKLPITCTYERMQLND